MTITERQAKIALLAEFRKYVLLALLAGLNDQYRLVLRGDEHLTGELGIIYDRESGTRYFSMDSQTATPLEDIVSRPLQVVAALKRAMVPDFLDGLYKVGGRPGDILLMRAAPIVRPVVKTAELLHPAGFVAIQVQFVVALPERLPEGIKENPELHS